MSSGTAGMVSNGAGDIRQVGLGRLRQACHGQFRIEKARYGRHDATRQGRERCDEVWKRRHGQASRDEDGTVHSGTAGMEFQDQESTGLEGKARPEMARQAWIDGGRFGLASCVSEQGASNEQVQLA